MERRVGIVTVGRGTSGTHYRNDHLRPTHPDVDLGIDARVREFDDRWLALADLADESGSGLGIRRARR